ncbi:MAG: dephospho-CoA kinase, partial [Gammaproteobacteria bacterium]|nr:dephospho-CoA kinase [Gammaproteobacteria bacterium]
MTTSGSSSAPTTGGDTGSGQPRRAAVVGLTGGIASGKSTAARILGELGAHVIDADRLGHRAYEPDTDAFRAVVEAFGADVVGADGRIDRKALGGKVFGDPTALTRLTDIVWPEILRLARLEIAQVRAKSPDKIVILEAAVLLEAGWQEAVDAVWVVAVEPSVAIARATARDGASAEAIQKRIDAQLSNQERIKRADVVILNDGSEQ